ncbi:helix-turn-helix domain-containing protein [uncultured Treponema sp.]|uniref:helix-turn-helix domain-containing protein n=1 Tax=uncultured Treponema sp. TaxID=162155 RepID=UPI0025D959E5|nr:helix-turn-helix transcriptional regulator [uncultured Treponema sp.]
MSFWTNVSYELEYQNISRKELAYKASIKEVTIHKAIERDSIPSADTALRIAKILNVPLERLLDCEDEQIENSQSQKLYYKYSTLINQLEKLSAKEKTAVLQLVDTLAKQY